MKLKLSLVAGLILLLTACSTLKMPTSLIKNHEEDYLSSENLPPLRIPAGVHTYPPDAYYTIPDSAATKPPTVSMLPPGSLAHHRSLEKNTGDNHAKR